MMTTKTRRLKMILTTIRVGPTGRMDRGSQGSTPVRVCSLKSARPSELASQAGPSRSPPSVWRSRWQQVALMTEQAEVRWSLTVPRTETKSETMGAQHARRTSLRLERRFRRGCCRHAGESAS